MLFLVYGNDLAKRKVYSDKLIETLQTKRPDALFTEYNENSFSLPLLDSLVASRGLFEEKNIVVIRSVLDDIEVWEYVAGAAGKLHNSDHGFVFINESVSKKILDGFESAGATIKDFSKTERASANFNLFALADLLAAQDGKRLWVQYHKALQQGSKPDEILGVFVWQLKSILLARSCSEQDSGLKPFVYKKSKGSKLSDEQTKNLYKKLVVTFHDSKRGGETVDEALEKMILSLS